MTTAYTTCGFTPFCALCSSFCLWGLFQPNPTGPSGYRCAIAWQCLVFVCSSATTFKIHKSILAHTQCHHNIHRAMNTQALGTVWSLFCFLDWILTAMLHATVHWMKFIRCKTPQSCQRMIMFSAISVWSYGLCMTILAGSLLTCFCPVCFA